jgi:lipid A 3-O-deacylase
MLRYLLGCIVTLLLLCAPVCAEGDYDPWQAFGIDEIRLGGMKHNLEGRRGALGVGYTVRKEDGVDVNGEVLFASPWPQPANPILDFLLRPRAMLGATINTQGDTSQVYLGAAWSLPVFSVLFVEATFGGSIHDGPVNTQYPDFGAAYGCRLNFHESGSFGVKLGGNWRIMATIEHMSNGSLCHPNAGLSNYGARLGYKFNP